MTTLKHSKEHQFGDPVYFPGIERPLIWGSDDQPFIDILNLPLLETDGEPLESQWHYLQIGLLLDVMYSFFGDRQDIFAGGNMFIYYDEDQAKTLSYRGPDVFFVKDTSRQPLRKYWAVWRERGRYPNAIIELTSPSTKKVDLTTKKDLYERTFRTSEYYCFDPKDYRMLGWRLVDEKYHPIEPNPAGRLVCESIGCEFGTWQGSYQGFPATWFRAFRSDGSLILRKEEAEKARADQAEAELAKLKKELAKKSRRNK